MARVQVLWFHPECASQRGKAKAIREGIEDDDDDAWKDTNHTD